MRMKGSMAGAGERRSHAESWQKQRGSVPAPCSHEREGKTLRHAPFMSMKRAIGRGNANEGEHGGSR